MSDYPRYVLEGRPFYFDFVFDDDNEESERIFGPELPAYATIVEHGDGDEIRLLIESNWEHSRLARWRSRRELKGSITLVALHYPDIQKKIEGLSLSDVIAVDPKDKTADEAFFYSMKK